MPPAGANLAAIKASVTHFTTAGENPVSIFGVTAETLPSLSIFAESVTEPPLFGSFFSAALKHALNLGRRPWMTVSGETTFGVVISFDTAVTAVVFTSGSAGAAGADATLGAAEATGAAAVGSGAGATGATLDAADGAAGGGAAGVLRPQAAADRTTASAKESDVGELMAAQPTPPPLRYAARE